MVNKTSVWILFLIASLLVACSNAPVKTAPAATETSQPKSLPVEFVWKITGDPNPFNAPVSVAVDLLGNIYVMDTKNSRIQKFDSDGKFILMWGGPGNSESQFTIIFPDVGCLAVDTQGNVYVIDVSNFRIQKFDSNGNFLTQWGQKAMERVSSPNHRILR